MLMKELPEQIRNPTGNSGGGVEGLEGFGLWVNSLALHSWLEESEPHKRQLFKEKTLFLRTG